MQQAAQRPKDRKKTFIIPADMPLLGKGTLEFSGPQDTLGVTVSRGVRKDVLRSS
jgi:hypothetical protein